jgi:hypothetical protein
MDGRKMMCERQLGDFCSMPKQLVVSHKYDGLQAVNFGRGLHGWQMLAVATPGRGEGRGRFN